MFRNVIKSFFSISLLALSACATVPTGPSVTVIPASGKPFEVFAQEDASCRRWAEQQTGLTPQETMDKNTATGAIAGTALGAGAGALIGSASGHAGAGALIGAASGLLVGTAAGANSGQIYGREAQRRYDSVYLQCMYANGNQIPGRIRRARRIYSSYDLAPPPPPIVRSQSSESIPSPPPGATPQTPPELLERKGGMR